MGAKRTVHNECSNTVLLCYFLYDLCDYAMGLVTICETYIKANEWIIWKQVL